MASHGEKIKEADETIGKGPDRVLSSQGQQDLGEPGMCGCRASDEERKLLGRQISREVVN